MQCPFRLQGPCPHSRPGLHEAGATAAVTTVAAAAVADTMAMIPGAGGPGTATAVLAAMAGTAAAGAVSIAGTAAVHIILTRAAHLRKR